MSNYMNIGASEVEDIYLGADEVEAIYLGSDLVYQSGTITPE